MNDFNRYQKSAQFNSSPNSTVTQPIKADQSKNVKRAQQISSLHKQFEDLKKKIKDVQSKNESIIEKIHKDYNFKKKSPQTQEFITETSPIIYYEKQEKSQISGVDNASNKSNESQYEYKMVKKISRNSVNPRSNVVPQQFNQSMQYRKTDKLNDEHLEAMSSTSKGKGRHLPSKSSVQNQMQGSYPYSPPYPINPQFNQSAQQYSPQVSQYSGINPFQPQMSMQYTPQYSQAHMQTPIYSNSINTQSNINHLEESLHKEREKYQKLQEEMSLREVQIFNLKKMQKKVQNFTSVAEEIIQYNLEEFMEDVVKKKMQEIEKNCKKNQNKLKKLLMTINHKKQDARSTRNISQNRRRRSNSRSKRQEDGSPNKTIQGNTSFTGGISRAASYSINKKASSINLVEHNLSTAKEKSNDSLKSNKQFEEIAHRYEEIIQQKNKEILGLEDSLKMLQGQILEAQQKSRTLQFQIKQLTQSKINQEQPEENLLLSTFNPNQSGIDLKWENKYLQLQNQFKNKSKETQFKNIKINQLLMKNQKLKKEIQKQKEDFDNFTKKDKSAEQIKEKLQRSQKNRQNLEKQYNDLKEKIVKLETESIQKQCESFSLKNKIKKLDTILEIKTQKIAELQKIIQITAQINTADMDKSVCLDKTEISDQHYKEHYQKILLEKQLLDEDLQKMNQKIFILNKNIELSSNKEQQMNEVLIDLKKQNEKLVLQNQSIKINQKALEFEKYNKQNSNAAFSASDSYLSEEEPEDADEKHILKEELEEITKKYEELQKNYKILKNDSLQNHTKSIKFNSQINYLQEALAERQNKSEKLKKQFEECKANVSEMNLELMKRQDMLENQRKVNTEKINQLQRQFIEYQQQNLLGSGSGSKSRKHSEQDDLNQLKNSRNFSEASFLSVSYKNSYETLKGQNEQLNEKVKQYEIIVQTQNMMENKIMEEYKLNIEKVKYELKEKHKTVENQKTQIERLNMKLRNLQERQSRSHQKQTKNGINENGEDPLYLDEKQLKIIELQNELNEVKDINNKISQVEQELFHQIQEKEEQKNEILRILSIKNQKIQELEDIIELKEINFSSHISSHNKSSKMRESMKSQSSLRYSMLSQAGKDKVIDLELSEAGEQYFQHSMISNVSEMFGKEQFPYQKMQLKRKEQARLFEKTASYIKSLKNAIEEKNKRIKMLQKKIESLRNSELIRKDIYDIKESNDSFPFDEDDYKDYKTVQLQYRKSSNNKLKQLEHQTKLTIQENNLLINQIQNLQEELLKAEEQENSLVKIKDLYKDQIKRHIKKNQEMTKIFQEEIKLQRKKIEESQSIHNLEALRQLFVKIMTAFAQLEAEGLKSKKREERKKQIADYVKVFCNIIKLDPNVREKILLDIHK